MYALRVFGSRLSVSADDLAIPATVALMFRVLWLIANVAFLAIVASDRVIHECVGPQAASLTAFVGVVLAAALVSTGLFTAMYVIANRGSLLEPELRTEPMVKVLYALLASYVSEIVLGVWGIVIAVQWPSVDSLSNAQVALGCEGSVSTMGTFALVATVFVFIDTTLFFSFWWLFLNRNKVNVSGLRADNFELKSLQWQARCRRWCNVGSLFTCGLMGHNPNKTGGSGDHAYAVVGDVFASFFHELKLTPTDLLAGVFLIKAEQAAERKAKAADKLVIRIDGENPATQDSSANNKKLTRAHPSIASIDAARPQEKKYAGVRIKPKFEMFPSGRRSIQDSDMMMTLCEIHEMLDYSEAINSWKLHLMNSALANKTLSGVAELVKESRRHARHRAENREQHAHDNCCAWNHATFTVMNGIKPEDLVYSHFVSYANELVAFAVAVDHAKRSVVLTFRGSLSLHDWLTDASLYPESLHKAGEQWNFDGKGHYAHTGFLSVALKIRTMLEENGVLHKLFRRMNHPDRITKEQRDAILQVEWDTVDSANESTLPDCSGYSMVVIGESLGAAVASVTSLLLKSDFPELRGYGVSTPGCIFDFELAESMSDYFTTIFTGKDIVPRLSWAALIDMRKKVLLALRRSKTSKLAILKSPYKSTPVEDLMWAPEDVPDTPGVARIETMMRNVEQATDKNSPLFTIPLYCPGKILHMAKTQTVTAPRLCGLLPSRNVRSYEPFWVKDRKDLCEISISSNMFMDHMPFRVRTGLEHVIDFAG